MSVFVRGEPPRAWADQIKDFVRNRYAHLVEGDAFPPGGAERALKAGYPEEWVRGLPENFSGSYCGCGFALEGVSFAGAGDVLDLGCGAGLDARLMAGRLGPGGRVFALDMTLPMLRRTREMAPDCGAGSVLPVGGDMERLPFSGARFDLVFANASLNLTIDKECALREIHRVLRPGGKLIARELIREGELPPEIGLDPTAWNASLGGVLEESEWLRLAGRAGFAEVAITGHSPFAPVVAVRLEAKKPE
ncbi:MAG: methyltransferase domain-containing protein [bacterium]|nr:methyltransferase domain-containing protein [bacterium]